MKINRLFSIAAAALMMVACSSEETALNNNPAVGSQMQFTATIAAPGSGATTRTEYSESGKDINVAWSVGDEIALIHNGVKDVATVEKVNADGSATITGIITGTTNEADVRLVYPAARVGEVTGGLDGTEYSSDSDVEGKLLTQDGTLKYIQKNLDFRSDMNQLSVEGDKATLAYPAEDMAAELAIWKLTLQDDAETPAALSATQVSVILDGEEPVTIASTTTLSTATSTVYLAMDMINEEDLTIEATVGEDTYSYTKNGVTLAAGTYYQSTVTMAKAVATYREYSYTTSLTYKDVSIPSDAKTVSSSTTSWSGTYTVDGSVTINGDVECTGDVNLILLDGSKLTVNGHIYGVTGSQPDSYSLNIYAQSEGSNMGALYIDAGNSENNLVVKNLAIHGGKIVATNGEQALEAYGPFKIYGGDISTTGSIQGIMATTGGLEIHGGKLVANGGFNGINAYACNVTITGGNVTANSTGTIWGGSAGLYVMGNLSISGNSVVIGTSASNMEGIQAQLDEEDPNTGVITISGNPTVKAYGGPGSATGMLWGGIGLNGIQINISGGTITAVGGNGANGGVDENGAGIDGGLGGNGVEGDINITGGTLKATGGNGGNGGNATGENKKGGNGGFGGNGIIGEVTGSGADSAINAATGGTGGTGGTGEGTGDNGDNGADGAKHRLGLN